MNSRTFRLFLMLLCFAQLLTACGNKEASTEGKDEAANQAADTAQYSIVRENHLDADGNIINIIDSKYDADGVLRRIEEHYPGASESHRWALYEYDELGRLTIVRSEIDSDFSGYTTRFEYEGDSNRVSKKTMFGEIWNYAYDEAGRMIREEYEQDSKAHPDYGYIYEYEWDGDLLVKMTVYKPTKLNSSTGYYFYPKDDSGNKKEEYHIEYSYDDQGNLLHEETLYKTTLNITKDYTLNSDGLVTETNCTYYNDMGYEQLLNAKYTYDEYGNELEALNTYTNDKQRYFKHEYDDQNREISYRCGEVGEDTVEDVDGYSCWYTYEYISQDGVTE